MNAAALSALHELANITTEGKLGETLDGLALPPHLSGNMWQANREAILFWRLFMAAGGPDLDGNIWKAGKAARAAFAEAIEAALVNNTEPSHALGQFLLLQGPGVATSVLQGNLDAPGVLDYDWQEELLELFKVEIARAFLAVQVLRGSVPLSKFQEHRQRVPVPFNNNYQSQYTQL